MDLFVRDHEDNSGNSLNKYLLAEFELNIDT